MERKDQTVERAAGFGRIQRDQQKIPERTRGIES